jgi:hypothetical protein
MSLYKKLNQYPSIYKFNLAVFILSLIVSSFYRTNFGFLWLIAITVLSVTNLSGLLISLLLGLVNREKYLKLAKQYFLSFCLILLIGVPICLMQIKN